jgi:hypothetical protein
MDKQKAERWSGEEPPMLDTIASLTRTAMDEGFAYDGVNDTDLTPEQAKSYVIDKMDDLIDLLNPSTETTDSFARSLTVLGRHLADRLDRMENLMLDDGEDVWGVAIEQIDIALDAIDEAIASLTPEEEGA